MNFKVSLFLVFWISFGFFRGQTLDSIDIDFPKKTDSLLNSIKETDNTIYPKKFPENYKNKYKTEEFDYTESKPQESLWTKIQRKFRQILEAIFGKIEPDTYAAENIMKALAAVIVGLAMYFLIKFLMSKEGNFFFSKKNKKINITIQEINENIHEIDFGTSISQYEQNQDFRYAVRYQFLWILKKLSDKNIIDWNPEKTNRDYILEIKNPNLKQDFTEISKIFEYVWYGEFEINEKSYTEMKNQCKIFHEKI